MEGKISSPTLKILGIGCTVTGLLTLLGALITSVGFVIGLLSSPEYQNAPPGAEGLLFFGTIPFFGIGAAGGALLGVVISVVIAIVIWRRAKVAQDEGTNET
jgi:hypothetical protein